MIRNNRRRFHWLALLAATASIAVGAKQALAMYGMDMGFMGGFSPVPQPGNFINQHALIRAGQASTAPGALRIRDHPDSAANRSRNSGFSLHYGLESRRPPAFEVDRRRSPGFTQTSNTQRPSAPAPAPAPAPATDSRPVFPIGSFFDASRRLVWPTDSPVADDLHAKRDISDQACLVVSDKVDKYRSAPITLVTAAREKLLVYGQPALQVARSSMTPRIAESFHNFLLSLYDSLAQAANPPEAMTTTNSTP